MRLIVMEGAHFDLDTDIEVDDFDFQPGSYIEGTGATITTISETDDYCGRCRGHIDAGTELNIIVQNANDFQIQLVGQSGYVNDLEIDTPVGCLYLFDGPNHRISGDLILPDASYIDFENVTDTLRATAIYGPTGMGEDCIVGNALWEGMCTIEHNIWGSIDWRSTLDQKFYTAGLGVSGRIDTSGFVGGTELKIVKIVGTDVIEMPTQSLGSLRWEDGATLKTDALESNITLTGYDDEGYCLYTTGIIQVDNGEADLNLLFTGSTAEAHYRPSSGRVNNMTVNTAAETITFNVSKPIDGKFTQTAGAVIFEGVHWSFGYSDIAVNDELLYNLHHFDVAIDYDAKGVGGLVTLGPNIILVSSGCSLAGVPIPDDTVPGNYVDVESLGSDWVVGDSVYTWIGGTGDVSDVTHWLPAKPGVGDNVFLLPLAGSGTIRVDEDTAVWGTLIDAGSSMKLVGDGIHYLNVGGVLHVILGKGGGGGGSLIRTGIVDRRVISR